jgi:hypothetical protein
MLLNQYYLLYSNYLRRTPNWILTVLLSKQGEERLNQNWDHIGREWGGQPYISSPPWPAEVGHEHTLLLSWPPIFVAGGRGKDGAPIITFPEFVGFKHIPEEDFLNVVTYLTSIPRWAEHSVPLPSHSLALLCKLLLSGLSGDGIFQQLSPYCMHLGPASHPSVRSKGHGKRSAVSSCCFWLCRAIRRRYWPSSRQCQAEWTKDAALRHRGSLLQCEGSLASWDLLPMTCDHCLRTSKDIRSCFISLS